MKFNKYKVLIVFGTRPEAIKLAPVIHKIKNNSDLLKAVICVTAQHREMLDQVLSLFEIKPDYDLDLMTKNQSLPEITTRIIISLNNVILKEKPDLIMVQGDTTTCFAAALAAFYNKVKIAHIEAGLRTDNKYCPFPEEINRRLTSNLADLHFAPTEKAKNSLLKEAKEPDKIFVTGNTVIDALLWVVKKQENNSESWNKYFYSKFKINFNNQNKILLVTGHRRESFGEGFNNICDALYKIAKSFEDILIIYPVHLNPNVQNPVYSKLGKVKNIILIEPLQYEPFIYLMNKSYIILTDSGGVQEEAPSLGKPVLVMRENTERPEGVEAGASILVGTNLNSIFNHTANLIENKRDYENMSKTINPYGDGKAANRIYKIIRNYLCSLSK